MSSQAWSPIAGRFAHVCEFNDGAFIDENCDAIVNCRCYTLRAFFDAQDKRAVAMDAERVPQE